MKSRTWVIFGATSIIAKEFAHIVASKGQRLRLVGRNKADLELKANDLSIRYQIHCEAMILEQTNILKFLDNKDGEELDLFIAQSAFGDNSALNHQSITELVTLNVLTTALIIHEYLNKKQTKHQIIYLSSVAARRGRAKNSLYGATKAAIEIYLEGLQQASIKNQQILIARLGYIDTRQTYGLPGIFYPAQPYECALACLQALVRGKRYVYFPFFWRVIMFIVTKLPFVLYKKLIK